MTAHGFNQTVRESQAEAEPAVFARHRAISLLERDEQLRELLVWDARSVVFELDAHERAILVRLGASTQDDVCSGRRETHGVVEQNVENLEQALVLEHGVR